MQGVYHFYCSLCYKPKPPVSPASNKFSELCRSLTLNQNDIDKILTCTNNKFLVIMIFVNYLVSWGGFACGAAKTLGKV